ncbi:hypothetical protein [Longimicrobium sp.]|uniref:hypothetical protein n=1 Tax=Longimicrobium sp. TaxID=2029185 RepID=UPI002E35446F|nr:hypothetical protein [Longimicrobium sp.]
MEDRFTLIANLAFAILKETYIHLHLPRKVDSFGSLQTFISGVASMLANIENAVGIDAGIAQRLAALEAGEESVAAAIDETLSIPITNGKGTFTTPKKTTFWVRITGTGTVTAPQNGTWSVKVVDLVADRTVFEGSGIGPNQPVDFSYKTGFTAQLQASGTWSEGGDTTLKLHIQAST